MIESTKNKITNTMMRFGRTEVGTPVISEYFGSNKWINFGINNDYPQELIRLFQNADMMHSTLIERKVKMIAGNGFTTETPFINNEYSKDNLNVIVLKLAYDQVIFNGFYINIIWSADGTQISQIEHLPYEKMRVAKYDSDKKNNELQLDGFYFSKDWLRKSRSENIPKFLPDFYQDKKKLKDEFDIDEITFNQMFPSQVMFIKTYTPGLDYYTLPYYSSSINWIKLEYEISTYHLKNVQNGLMPGMVIINKSGIPTAEERDAIDDDIKRTLVGADNAGTFINVYAENKDLAPEFVPIQLNSSDQRFRDLKKQIDSTIMMAHQFTSSIAGIETSGKLGSKDEIADELQYMQTTVIDPNQKQIQDALNKILKINGSDEKVELKKFTIYDLEKTTTTN